MEFDGGKERLALMEFLVSVRDEEVASGAVVGDGKGVWLGVGTGAFLGAFKADVDGGNYEISVVGAMVIDILRKRQCKEILVEELLLGGLL